MNAKERSKFIHEERDEVKLMLLWVEAVETNLSEVSGSLKQAVDEYERNVSICLAEVDNVKRALERMLGRR